MPASAMNVTTQPSGLSGRSPDPVQPLPRSLVHRESSATPASRVREMASLRRMLSHTYASRITVSL